MGNLPNSSEASFLGLPSVSKMELNKYNIYQSPLVLLIEI